jgi:hypothetical protein
VTVNEKEQWNWESTSSTPTTSFIFQDTTHYETTPVIGTIQPQITHDEPEVRRSERARATPSHLQDFDVIPDSMITNEGDLVHLALFVDIEPLSYNDAAKSPVWRKAMEDEIQSIEKNKTWQLMRLNGSTK